MSKYQTWELTPNEVLEGLVVTFNANATVNVSAGRVRIDGKLVEIAATTAVNAATGAAPIDVVVYVNPDTDYDGNALTRVSFTPEPNHTKTNINGSVGTRYSRSIPLAIMKTLTTTANISSATINNNYRENPTGFIGMRSELGE